MGSVGLKCWVVLLEGWDETDLVILQVKEAGASVLEAHLRPSGMSSHGKRVVVGQRMLQAASDAFLGWMAGATFRHFYWRQLWDMKGSYHPSLMTPQQLQLYARSGDPVAIAGYLGRSNAFDRAITEFATGYADLARTDHAAMVAAIGEGRIASAV